MMKSALLFFVHFLILVVIIAGLILEDKFSDLRGHMKAYGADYLYALFCLFLLIGITYFYFLFETRNYCRAVKP